MPYKSGDRRLQSESWRDRRPVAMLVADLAGVVHGHDFNLSFVQAGSHAVNSSKASAR